MTKSKISLDGMRRIAVFILPFARELSWQRVQKAGLSGWTRSPSPWSLRHIELSGIATSNSPACLNMRDRISSITALRSSIRNIPILSGPVVAGQSPNWSSLLRRANYDGWRWPKILVPGPWQDAARNGSIRPGNILLSAPGTACCLAGHIPHRQAKPDHNTCCSRQDQCANCN